MKKAVKRDSVRGTAYLEKREKQKSEGKALKDKLIDEVIVDKARTPRPEPEKPKTEPEKKEVKEAKSVPEKKEVREAKPVPEKKEVKEAKPAPEKKEAGEQKPAPEKKEAKETRPEPEKKAGTESKPEEKKEISSEELDRVLDMKDENLLDKLDELLGEKDAGKAAPQEKTAQPQKTAEKQTKAEKPRDQKAAAVKPEKEKSTAEAGKARPEEGKNKAEAGTKKPEEKHAKEAGSTKPEEKRSKDTGTVKPEEKPALTKEEDTWDESELLPREEEKPALVPQVMRKLFFMLSLAVFCYAGASLAKIGYAYWDGARGYHEINESSKKGNGTLVNPTIPTQPAETSGGDVVIEVPTKEGETETETEPAAWGLDIYPYAEGDIYDHAFLSALNSDYVGYIFIPGVGIEYPMVQGTDNEHYLRYTIDNRENIAGSIFLSYQDKRDLSGFNTVINGHNQKNGKMFAELKQFQNQEKVEENPYIYIVLPDRGLLYEIVAVVEEETVSIIYNPTLSASWQKDELINLINSKPGVHRDITLTGDDHLITLVTCTDDSSHRICTVARCVNWH